MSAARTALEELGRARFLDRLRARDASLWTEEKGRQKAIRNSLGWLDLPSTMAAGLGTIRSLVSEVRAEGFKTSVILGMGGASLAAGIFRACRSGLEVLDTTNPSDILALRSRLDLRSTFFIAASKSGSTIETNCLLSYFHALLSKEGLRPQRHFAAITDPGTSLEKKARRMEFRKVYLNPPGVGGRFSALSYFGLVPAALAGMDIEAILTRARRTAEDLGPALELGASLSGKDTLSLITSPRLRPLGLWIEQLLCESTGKEGKGILPIMDVPHHLSIGPERLSVSLSFAGEKDPAEGRSSLRMELKDENDLGSQFMLWETAVAAAGFLLKINPFDQPDVQSAKDRTGELLSDLAKGKLAPEEPSLRAGGLAAFCDPELSKALGARPGIDLPLKTVLAAHLGRLKADDFCAILAFLPDQEAELRLLAGIKERLNAPTTLGMGPRYLHSTGQFHKGGSPRGLYLLLTEAGGKDLPVPLKEFTFGTLHKAQARGDFQAMLAAGRRILRLDLGPAGAHSLKAVLNSLGED